MSRKLQIKRGLLAKIPTLAQGEFGMTTNSGSERLFIGTGSQNLEIPFLRALRPYTIGALPESLGDNRKLVIASGDRTFVNFNFDASVPDVPTASNYTYFMTIKTTDGSVESALALPLDSTNKVYSYSRGRGEWEHITSAEYAITKTGDQTMSGTLTMRSLKVTDGYMNGSVSTDGTTSRVQILSSNPSTGKAGAILVGPNGIHFMDGNGYEYRVVHEGNIGQFLGVAAATVE